MKHGLLQLLKFPIHVYRYFISPVIGSRCRYNPTCSEYALKALDLHGPVKGLVISTLRIVRCNPWVTGKKEDPVPTRFTYRACFGYKNAHNKKKPCKENKVI